MARAITNGEQTLFRTPGQWSKLYAAIFHPATIYTARINQVFATTDQVLEITYDGGSGTLASVLPDMTLLVGSSAGAHDKGICRVRGADATKFYISETSDVEWEDNLYLTVINAYALWAKHVLIDDNEVVYMDGGVTYSDQHENPDPLPIMGSHRVLKLTGATVSASFDWSASRVIDGSAISARSTSCPGSASITNGTTNTPTIAFNAAGWYPVYLTLTAANGKSFTGVRYVYVWDDEHPPVDVVINDCGQDVDTGGWTCSLTAFGDVDLDDVMDRALVIIFAEDHYGTTAQSIGYLAGCENVVLTGWISAETINFDSQSSYVDFTIDTGHSWLGRIPSFPDGVEFKASAPTVWTQFKNLTVDKGAWHMLHWRSTATRVMDCFFTGDTKLTKEVSSLASNLWEQLREMTNAQVLARPGVNRYNQLFMDVDPQLIPEASRSSIPTVMSITEEDWVGELSFSRMIVPNVSLVYLSGVSVNSSGTGSPLFALSPGHAYPQYGEIMEVSNLLLSSQSQANTLAGLVRAQQNNMLPEIQVPLAANNRMLDCFPNQRCSITIYSSSNVRGFGYSGYVYPTAIRLSHNLDDGCLYMEITFEAETFESQSMNGDVPGSGDRSVPPLPPLPPLPDIPPIVPGGPPTGTTGAGSVIMHDATFGIIYTTNFSSSSPNWLLMNAGLTESQKTHVDRILVCPNGAIYCASRQYGWIARAASLGAEWVIIEDMVSIGEKYEGTPSYGLCSVAINPLLPECFAYVIGGKGNHDLYIGAAGSYAPGAHFTTIMNTGADISYGFGEWRVTAHSFTFQPLYFTVSQDGSTINEQGNMAPIWWLEPLDQVFAGTTNFGWLKAQNSLIRFVENFKDQDPDSTDMGGAFNATGITADSTGQYLMGRQVYLNGRGKSSDFGASWSGLPNLPAGSYVFACAGPPALWVAAGAVVRATTDFGTTWVGKEGDLSTITPTPAIGIVKVVS